MITACPPVFIICAIVENYCRLEQRLAMTKCEPITLTTNMAISDRLVFNGEKTNNEFEIAHAWPFPGD